MSDRPPRSNGKATRVVAVTAPTSGAVALLQLHGRGAAEVLAAVTGVADWPASRVRLVQFSGIDEGLAVLLREGDDGWAQLMPHGGPRVVQKLLDRLIELGAAYDADPPARELYPEARTELEADMLATLARAASPAAIDLLLAQPAIWRSFLLSAPGSAGGFLSRPSTTSRVENARATPANTNDARARGESKTGDSLSPGSQNPPAEPGAEGRKDILNRSAVLDRLVDPPSIVVVGRPNVGKSTLTNRVLGRAASIVADLPGTTRDWVAGLAEIEAGFGGVAVRWMDTPGIRASGDAIEQRAIELARGVIAQADVLIAMRDNTIDWPDAEALPRAADIWVVNKDDAGGAKIEGDALAISAATGSGVETLQRRVLEKLSLSSESLAPRAWAFSARLRGLMTSGDRDALARYVGESRSD